MKPGIFVLLFMGMLLTGCSALPFPEKSANADLGMLTVDQGVLAPNFEAATTSYTVHVPNEVTSITVTGSTADEDAGVSDPVTLSDLVVGTPQTAIITVTAENGVTRTYTVEVLRDLDLVNDVNARRTEILTYISNLSNESSVGTISGQNAYHGTEIVDGYRSLVEELHTQSGEWVGILGVDYEFSKSFTPEELSLTNQVLIDYARTGGLITVTFTPQNPWVNDESDLAGDPGTWNGPAGTQNKDGFTQVNLNDLIDPAKPVNAAWMRKLDRIAGALHELREAGVIVLFRPMQEMNGNWFWWGMSSHPNDPEPYVNLYRHMHDYFTNTKELNNLIWLYSPNASFGVNNSANWNRTVDWAYPGDDYVDIIAGTNYYDKMILVDYPAYVSMNKPLGIAEFGPTIGGPAATDGTWDTSQIIATIEQDYPRVAFWVSWHSYPQQNWSLIANQNFDLLLNDASVINRDDFTWSWLP
jgi:mannan endo-1,4-beta-mannosidase